MSFEIIEAKPVHAAALQELYMASTMAFYGQPELGLPANDRNRIVQELTSAERLEARRCLLEQAQDDPDDRHWRIALLGRNIVGHLEGLYRPDMLQGTNRIANIQVLPGFQGKSHGVSRMLMEDFLGWADLKHPEKPTTLRVVVQNERARRFYARYGFTDMPNTEKPLHDILITTEMIRPPAVSVGE